MTASDGCSLQMIQQKTKANPRIAELSVCKIIKNHVVQKQNAEKIT